MDLSHVNRQLRFIWGKCVTSVTPLNVFTLTFLNRSQLSYLQAFTLETSYRWLLTWANEFLEISMFVVIKGWKIALKKIDLWVHGYCSASLIPILMPISTLCSLVIFLSSEEIFLFGKLVPVNTNWVLWNVLKVLRHKLTPCVKHSCWPHVLWKMVKQVTRSYPWERCYET